MTVGMRERGWSLKEERREGEEDVGDTVNFSHRGTMVRGNG